MGLRGDVSIAAPNNGDNPMPRVSLITPTVDREDFLPALWDCIRVQSEQDFERLVHDGSGKPTPLFDQINDKRVRYMPVPGRMTIGAKRNALCNAAKGEIIAHLDDDDFYGPRYIEGMLSFMTDLNVDFVKLFGFFLYRRSQKILAYWDLERDFPQHYRLHPVDPLSITVYRGGVAARWGYGFSYVFRRRVWEEIHFPEDEEHGWHGEDQIFADAAVAKFRSAGKQDFGCSCLHVIHNKNISFTYPQQILPSGLVPTLFPKFSFVDCGRGRDPTVFATLVRP
jgi:glycosyltransferase involved in cell wall biosynthesis